MERGFSVLVGNRVSLEAHLVTVRLTLDEHFRLGRRNVQLTVELAGLLVAVHLGVADGLDLAVLAKGNLHDHVVRRCVVVERPLLLLVINDAEQQTVSVVLEALHHGITVVLGLAVFVGDLGGHDDDDSLLA